MKYLILIYALFILMFDFFSTGGQSWNIVYYAVQYGFAASVALIMLFDGRHPRIVYLLASAFFSSLAICEISMIRFDQSEYFLSITSPEPFYQCGMLFIVLSVILIMLKRYVK